MGILFLFLLKNIDCGYSLELPRRGGSNMYPQYVLSIKKKNIIFFFTEIFNFYRWKKIEKSMYIAWACFRNNRQYYHSVSIKDLFVLLKKLEKVP